MSDSHEDDFTNILPIFMWGDENTAGAVAGDMERAIQKATKVITLHSITVKPEFKNGPQSEKQKELYAMNEYNKFVPGNYLLMGKAYLFRHDFHLARFEDLAEAEQQVEGFQEKNIEGNVSELKNEPPLI